MSHPFGAMGLYLLATAPALAGGPWTAGHAALAGVHLAVAALCVAWSVRGAMPGPRLAWLLLLALPFLYWEVPHLNQAFSSGYHDAALLPWEAALFGAPATALAGRFPSPLLSETLHTAYLSFYPLIYLPPALLFLRGRPAAFVTSAEALAATAMACYAVFVYFPVQGPRYLGAPEGIPAGPMRSLALTVLESGSSRGAAFPSAHMAIMACQSVITLYFQRRLGIAVAAATAALGAGAVYGGFHYGVDIAAGAALGAGVGIAFLTGHDGGSPADAGAPPGGVAPGVGA